MTEDKLKPGEYPEPNDPNKIPIGARPIQDSEGALCQLALLTKRIEHLEQFVIQDKPKIINLPPNDELDRPHFEVLIRTRDRFEETKTYMHKLAFERKMLAEPDILHREFDRSINMILNKEAEEYEKR